MGGGVENVCECWYNADFSKGCISQVPVELMREVIDNGGVYADGNFAKYLARDILDWQRCWYCYGRGMNFGNVFPREVNKKTRKSFEKHKPGVVRLGKFVDCGHPYYYKTLMDFVGLCREFNSSIIFPNKMLPFGLDGAVDTAAFARNGNDIVAQIAQEMKMISGEELAEKLQEVEASLMYSLGFDGVEKGACSQGFTNEWRINQALRYHGLVNVSLTVVADLGQSIEENPKLGSPIKRDLDLREDGMNVRLLPLRINWREVSEFVAGCGFEYLIYRPDEKVIPGTEKSLMFPVVEGVE